jgi:hypothetical protein
MALAPRQIRGGEDVGDAVSGGVEPSRWVEITRENPGHSNWYVERFRAMVADGEDLAGEARFVDALVPRGARILDAGCGPGRVGSALARAGHDVVGVDVDPVLIAAAEQDHPGPSWLVGDLAELDLPARGVSAGLDAIVCAGNVVPSSRRAPGSPSSIGSGPICTPRVGSPSVSEPDGATPSTSSSPMSSVPDS